MFQQLQVLQALVVLKVVQEQQALQVYHKLVDQVVQVDHLVLQEMQVHQV